MANKIFNTRIQLKYDSYANWSGNNPVLLAGEMAIASIESGVTQEVNSVIAPQVLIKVGDGTSHYNDLPFVSAKSADVYDWAKQATLTVKAEGAGNVVSSISWDATLNGGKGGIKYETASVATSEGLKALQDAVKAIEDDYLTSADKTELVNSIATKVAIDDFNAFKEQNTKDIAAAQKAGEDAAAAVQKNLDEEAARAAAAEEKALTDAKAYTDEKNTAMDVRVAGLEAKFGDGEGSVADQIADAVAAETSAREAAVKGVQDNLDALSTTHASDKATLEGSIAAANEAAEGAQADVDALAEKVGEVPTDKTVVGMISEAQAAAEKVATDANTAMAARVKAIEDDYLKAADKEELQGKIDAEAATARAAEKANADAIKAEKDRMDAFMLAADVTTDAVDTLKEIQDYISTDGAAAAKMTEDIAGNKKAIEDEVAAARAAEEALSGRIDAINDHSHTFNETELNKIVDGDVDKWNSAQANAEKTASDALAAAKTELEGKITAAQTAAESKATELNSAMDLRVKDLEAIDHDAYKTADAELKSTLETAIAKKVDAVDGKGLSTNDYTTEEKNKLAGIADGAQANVIETVKVNGVALTPDASKAVDVTVPTGALANKDKVAESDLTDELATKINGKVDASACGDIISKNEADFAAAGHDHDDVYSKLGHTHKIEELEQDSYIVFNCGSSTDVM